MVPQLQQFLLEHWDELPLGGPKPRGLSFLVQATGISKICCFVFADDAPVPRWVVRLPRAPRDNAILAHEYSMIAHLRRGGAYARATVPAPLWVTALEGHVIGIERYLPGRAMDGLMMQHARGPLGPQVKPYLDLALGWLLRAQQETLVHSGQLNDAHVHAYFSQPIARLRDTSALTARELDYLDCIEQQIRDLARLPLPLVFKHGDFQPGNILVDGDTIAVIDWEFGQARTLPLLDIFGFLARTHARWYGLEEMDGDLEDYLAGFEETFFAGGSFAAIAADYIARACMALGIDMAWVPLLFALFVVTEANKYYTLLSQRAERGYVYLLNSRAGRIGGSYAQQLARQKQIWLLGYLAEHADRLVFGPPGAMLPHAAAVRTAADMQARDGGHTSHLPNNR